MSSIISSDEIHKEFKEWALRELNDMNREKVELMRFNYCLHRLRVFVNESERICLTDTDCGYINCKYFFDLYKELQRAIDIVKDGKMPIFKDLPRAEEKKS